MAENQTPEPVDILILVGAEGEDDAVAEVTEGAVGAWQEMPTIGKYPLKVFKNTFITEKGEEIVFALTRTAETGNTPAAQAAGYLCPLLNASMLVMSGVCAGKPPETTQGDVIIADKVWEYDKGKWKEDPKQPGVNIFFPDMDSIKAKAFWKQEAQRFKKYNPPAGASWITDRPKPIYSQALWVLGALENKLNPCEGEESDTQCPDWKNALEYLQYKKFVDVDHELPFPGLILTEAGKKFLKDRLLEGKGKLPEPDAWKIHVGVMGTGSAVVTLAGEKRSAIWDELENRDRNVLGLDMEASAIGYSGDAMNIPFLVVKGVMDHADQWKNNKFRKFAARAAAEVLIAFLRKNFTPPERGKERDTPEPEGKEKAAGAASALLSPNIRTLPPKPSPALLLTASYQAVDFFEVVREKELASINEWVTDDGLASARLFYGPGGAGKTRLFIHVAKKLREQGWEAGFLAGKAEPEDLGPLLASSKPLLVVIDYPETRPQIEKIMAALARKEEGQKLRVALLSREPGDWWKALCQHLEIRHLVAGHDIMELAPVPLEGDLRKKAFQHVCKAFAPKLSKALPEKAPDLSHHRFGRMLYISMAAYLEVMGKRVAPESVLEEILDREKGFWKSAFEEESCKIRNSHAFIQAASRLMAAATLLGGVETLDASESINKLVQGPTQEEALGFFHDLYRFREDAAEKEKAGEALKKSFYLSPLEPDLLGELLSAQALTSPETPEDYIEKIFAEAGPEQVQHGLTLLGRLCRQEENPELFQKALAGQETILFQDVQSRALPALLATMALGREKAFVPLGNILADALEQKGTTELGYALASVFPEQAVSLPRAACWAAGKKMAVRKKQAELEPEKYLPDLAKALGNLGVRLHNLGRDKEALEAEEQATEIFRKLAEIDPANFRALLAQILNNFGNRLSDLGKKQEALDAAQEAADIYHELAKQNPDAFLQYFAGSLNNLGSIFAGLGKRQEALDTTQEAADIYRKLARQNPDAFLPDLAMSLNNLGNKLSSLGKKQEALEAGQEAADIYRTLARQNPDAFLQYLAASLNNLGSIFSGLGKRHEALEAAQEAADIYRTLARQNPDAFLPALSLSLNNLGNMFSGLGKGQEALEAAQEAVHISRELARQNPDAFLPDLAIGLNNLGIMFSDLGKRQEALDAAQEAADIYRKLARQNPDAFLPNLAGSLSNLGNCSSKLEKWQEALEAAQEATVIRRELARHNPAAFLPDLAMSLNNLGNRLSDLARMKEALDAAQEAADIYRKLAKQNPNAFLPDLATSLNNLGHMFSELGRKEEALAHSREAVQIYTRLCEAIPQAFGQYLRISMGNLLERLRENGIALEEDEVFVRGHLVFKNAFPELFEKKEGEKG
ncbi:MAG: tetratricopeptide repeat protein [Thermodesulfobacteriota bacterium]